MSEAIEFKAWPKTPRLYRDVTITEKIDGTNGAIHITRVAEEDRAPDNIPEAALTWFVDDRGDRWHVGAQSRNRLLSRQSDNYGFAKWVEENAETLMLDLGEGTHYGEWWGHGIQRGYGLAKGDRRFSLFNTARYDKGGLLTPALGVVPALYSGVFDDSEVEYALALLRALGSLATFGYMDPEGVCIYHRASNQVFKVLLENDELPKGLVA